MNVIIPLCRILTDTYYTYTWLKVLSNLTFDARLNRLCQGENFAREYANLEEKQSCFGIEFVLWAHFSDAFHTKNFSVAYSSWPRI
jgi:hypothetical protein